MMYTRSFKHSGMTVIEIIVVVGVSFILLAALLRFLSVGFPLAKTNALEVRAGETARLQLRRMANTLRELKYSDHGAYPLVLAQENEIVFYADVDGDDLVERIRYQLVNGELLRGIVKPSGVPVTYVVADEEVVVVARNIVNDPSTPLFIYYSGNYPDDTQMLTSANIADISYIQFHLVIDVNTQVDPPPIDLKSQVQLRNLKTNLGEIS